MPAVLYDVAPDIALAEPRGNDRRSKEGKIDLPAVGMARERQRDPIRDQGKNVGVVGEGYRREVLRQAFENGADVGFHLPQVADSDEPKIESPSFDPNALVLEHSNAGRLEGGPDSRAVVPVVMIAEDREYPERRLELRQSGSDRFQRNRISPPDSGDHVVAGEKNDMGPRRSRPGDDGLELVDAVERRAHVEIAQESDEEAVLLGGPPRKRQLVAVDLERRGLEDEGP